MSKQIYLNLPVKDLNRATEFYQALGFVKNSDFSDQNATCVKWSEDIMLMLLTHDFYSKFTNKAIPDLSINSSCLISLNMDSKEEVQNFATIAKENGGTYFEAEPNKGLDFMYGLEVTDLDGHTLEPFFMDMTKFPNE